MTPARAAINVQDGGWDGRVLDACEDMPSDAPGGPAFRNKDEDSIADTTMRRLAEVCNDCICVPTHDMI